MPSPPADSDSQAAAPARTGHEAPPRSLLADVVGLGCILLFFAGVGLWEWHFVYAPAPRPVAPGPSGHGPGVDWSALNRDPVVTVGVAGVLFLVAFLVAAWRGRRHRPLYLWPLGPAVAFLGIAAGVVYERATGRAPAAWMMWGVGYMAWFFPILHAGRAWRNRRPSRATRPPAGDA